MTTREGCHPDVWAFLACCYFLLGMYSDADKSAQRGKQEKLYLYNLVHTWKSLTVSSTMCFSF